jgi:hypothetical protein
MTTIPLLNGLYQVCYVTEDLDTGMRLVKDTHGIEAFRIKREVGSLPGMPKMVVHQAHVFIGSLQLELIQPAGGDDALYRDYCPADAKSIGFHHFGHWVDDPAAYAALPAVLAEQKMPIVFQITMPNNMGGAIYADARASLGHYLEFVHMIPDVKRGYYADVPQL